MAEVVKQRKIERIYENGLVVSNPSSSGLPDVVDALEQVTISTNVEADTMIKKKLTAPANGVYDAPEGVAYIKVTVDVDGAGELEDITVTENGVYEPEEGSAIDGFKKVTVDVQPSDEEVMAIKQEQLDEDRAAINALSPITENGSYGIIGTVLEVDVEASDEEIAAAKEEGKAEQLAADQAEVEAVPTITENGIYPILEKNVIVDIPDPLATTYVVSKEIEIASNGERTIEASQPAGYDRFYMDKVTIKTNVVPLLEDKMIQANGSYTCSEGYDGFRRVIVDINGAPQVEEKPVTITENGTISVVPSSGKTGLSKVDITVDVQPTEDQIKGFKDEQAAADKAAIEALSPITTNGSKTIQIGDETAEVVVSVENAVSEYFDFLNGCSLSLTDGEITENSPIWGKTLRSFNPNNGGLSSSPINIIQPSYFAQHIPYNIETPLAPFTSEFYGEKVIAVAPKFTYYGNYPEISIENCGSGTADGVIVRNPYKKELTVNVVTNNAANHTIDTIDSNVNIKAPYLTGRLTVSGNKTQTVQLTQPGAELYLTAGSEYAARTIMLNPTVDGTAIYSHYNAGGGGCACSSSSPGVSMKSLYNLSPYKILARGNTPSSVNYHLDDLDYSEFTNSIQFRPSLVEVMGLTNFKNTPLDMSLANNLTYESIQNIKNTLPEVTGSHIIKISTYQRTKISDEDIADFVAKGWTVTVA